MSAPPQAGPNVPAERALRSYCQWFATTLPQERPNLAIAIAGFAAFAVTALSG